MKMIVLSVFLCESDIVVFDVQGDKGDSGAAGRDVSFSKSLLPQYLFVFCILSGKPAPLLPPRFSFL